MFVGVFCSLSPLKTTIPKCLLGKKQKQEGTWKRGQGHIKGEALLWCSSSDELGLWGCTDELGLQSMVGPAAGVA